MTSIPASASDEIGDHVHAVLAAGAVGDLDGAMRAVDEILAGHGAWGTYDLAESLVAEMVGELAPAEDEYWSLDFPGIEEAGYDLRWTARFISAYANADDETGVALYKAAIADGELRTCLGALVSSAVVTLRQP